MTRKPDKQGKSPRRASPTTITAFAIAQGDRKRDQHLEQSIRPCSSRRQWMDETPQRYAYRCIPLTSANSMGWEILNPYRCEILWHGGEQVADTQIRIEGLPGNAAEIGGLPKSHFGSGIVTWDLPFVFRTTRGIGLVASGPANHVKRGISPLEGFVETDWLPNGFTMNWKMTEPGFRVVFEAGEPVCRIYPCRRDYIESFQIDIRDPASDPAFKQRVVEWRADRMERLKNKTLDPTADPKVIWSGNYVKGMDTRGQVNAGHRNVFRCKPVKDSRDK